MSIIPARLTFAADGTPWSETYGDVYHSMDGGLEQARHVFLGGNDLPQRWRGRERFVVLETGFGLGLNFLATWQAWRDDPQRCRRLHFVSTELHPFSVDDLRHLHRRWPELAALATQLHEAWPPLAPGFHRLRLDGGAVTLTLLLGDALTMLQQLTAAVDAIYLDGFAPAKNPQIWSPEILRQLSRHAAANATLATWSVATPVREALIAAGWKLEKRPGFGAKREMLCGCRDDASAHPSFNPKRRAIVIGAGIAGSSCANILAARDWQVDLIERHLAPAQEASGNPAGVLLPMLARDAGNLQARLSRACYFYALRLLHELGRDAASPLRWAPCGIAQLAGDAQEESEMAELVARLALPSTYVDYIDREAMARLIERSVRHGGWHFPGGGWVSPPTLCRALIAATSTNIHTRFGCEVAQLRSEGEIWYALADDGTVLAAAEHVVLANAEAARRLLPDAELPFTQLRGQVSYLPGATLGDLHMVVSGDGYVTPPAAVSADGADGASICCLGASFDFADHAATPNLSGHLGNLDKLERMLPGAGRSIDAATLDGRVGFRTATPDRLPLIGTLPVTEGCRPQDTLPNMARHKGLHCLLGYGARGMVWAGLAAETLAAQLEGEPLPLENDIVAAVDPARFLLRAVRRGRRGGTTAGM